MLKKYIPHHHHQQQQQQLGVLLDLTAIAAGKNRYSERCTNKQDSAYTFENGVALFRRRRGNHKPRDQSTKKLSMLHQEKRYKGYYGAT